MEIDGLFLVVGFAIGLLLSRLSPYAYTNMIASLMVTLILLAVVVLLRNVWGVAWAGDLMLGLGLSFVFFRRSTGARTEGQEQPRGG